MPMPSMTGPVGYAASSSSPARYSDSLGPGTFEITKL